jgi:hypothetical protein
VCEKENNNGEEKVRESSELEREEGKGRAENLEKGKGREGGGAENSDATRLFFFFNIYCNMVAGNQLLFFIYIYFILFF